MLELAGVTLACVDTANHALALRALERSRSALRFAQTLLLTGGIPHGVDVPAGIAVRTIAPLASRDDYSRFVLKSLLAHIDTPHVLLVQWDGYVVNALAFDPAFLACDYIGAKWSWFDDDMRVGNGGFSLRSRKLLEALQDPRIQLVEAEDTTICRTYRPLLEREYGIRYADEPLADRFSFEAAYPAGKPFGFHGLYNFCRVMPQDELAELAPRFSDAIAQSLQLGQLLRNCVALGQWRAAAELARRRVAATPRDREARALLARAETALASTPVAGRNDPCPCGSGKRYKQCHGALASATPPRAGGAARTTDPTLVPGTARADPGSTAMSLAQQGVDAHRRGDIDAAERSYRQALEADPDQPLALHYLGVACFQRKQYAEALPLLQRSTAKVPTEPEFHNNLGLVLAAMDRNDDAIAEYRRTLELAPDHATASNNLGLALQAINRLPDAIAAFRRALAVAPAFAHAHWNLALALLASGDYAEGWVEYEWRLRLPELGGRAAALPVPRWGGEDLRGGTLLLASEQGIGDTLQFVRFAAALAERGIRVIVQAPATLCPLLATARGVAATAAMDGPLPACDAELPILSLGRILDVRPDTLVEGAYLRSDPALRVEAAQRIERVADGRRRIGIAWAGGVHHQNDHRRSLPPAMLEPLLAMDQIAWFSLQQGEREREIAQMATAGSLTRLPQDTPWVATAALIDALDAVVTVDTSIAHLAGALGKPAFVLLPFAPDWRWGLAATRTPWYPTARLFRQPRIGDWASVIADVRTALLDT
jgi:tetratricopeptide (TPR) repeat protein